MTPPSSLLSAIPSRDALQGIIEAVPVAILVSNQQGIICLTNEETRRMLGYSEAELRGLPVSSLLPESYHGPLRAFLLRFAREPGKTSTSTGPEFRLLCKDGTEAWVQMGFKPVQIEGEIYAVGAMIGIDERRRTEQALRDSEEKFSKAFLASPDAISVHEMATGRYVEANPGVLHFFGYSHAELIGKTPTELGFWVDLEERNTFVERLRRDGSVRDFKARFRLRHGEIRVAGLSAELMEIGGRPHNVTVLRDMTAHLQYEHALRDSEEKFATAFRVSPDIMSISELESGRYLEVNEAHERLFGFTREQSVGRSPLELGLITDPAIRDKMLREVEKTGRIRDLKVQARASDGRQVVVLLSAELITLAGKKCLLRVSHDVTAAMKAEQDLRESEEKFAKAFRNSPNALILSDLATGRYVEVNNGFERVTGYTSAEAVGRTSTDLNIWTKPADREALVGRLLEQGSVRGMEFNFRAKDGHLVVALCNGDQIEVAGRRCILSTFEDITERRKAEEQKARLEAQLKQTQKLEALGTLAGGIAHDFNNILSAMIVYRELAVMDIDQPDELRKHLAEIGLASNRAKDLVRQILTFSRQQQQERRAVRLHAVVREALQLLRASLPATIEILPVVDEQAPQVLADTSQVHQIMMNLATNAAHAMRDRPGRLKVMLVRHQVNEAQARLFPGLRPGTYVRLSIADTGTGMDEATVARMFEPFFTTKGPGEGTGLGLSVVHGIMEDHDGAIAVDSRPGGGTCFDLYFPQYLGSSVAIREADQSAPRGSGESILLLDDETPLCEAMRSTLHRLGYQVTAFTNPVEAVAWFRAKPEQFDLLVTDHTMPHMTGLDVIQEVHRVRPELSVLLVSGLSGTWTPEKLRGFSIRDVVAKPVDFAGLAQVVRRALDRRVNLAN